MRGSLQRGKPEAFRLKKTWGKPQEGKKGGKQRGPTGIDPRQTVCEKEKGKETRSRLSKYRGRRIHIYIERGGGGEVSKGRKIRERQKHPALEKKRRGPLGASQDVSKVIGGGGSQGVFVRGSAMTAQRAFLQLWVGGEQDLWGNAIKKEEITISTKMERRHHVVLHGSGEIRGGVPSDKEGEKRQNRITFGKRRVTKLLSWGTLMKKT